MAKLRRDKQGRYILPSGEKISLEQEKAFRRAVNNANAKRSRLIDNLPRSTNEKHLLFDGQKEWVFSKKSQKLGRFQNLADFNRYFINVKKVVAKNYIPNRMRIYRENLYKSYVTLFGEERGGELIKLVEGLNSKDFAKLTLDDTLKDIGFAYDEQISFSARYQAIRNNILQILGQSKNIRPITDEIDISEYKNDYSKHKKKASTQSYKGRFTISTGMIRTGNKARLI